MTMPRLPRLVLGTVQLGLPYGMANSTGLPDETEVFAILDAACESGIAAFDTARAYGLAEERIGRWLKARANPPVTLITKVPRLPETEDRLEALERSLAASLEALGRAPDIVMMHHEDDLLDPAVAQRLQTICAAQNIGRIGASVYSVKAAQRLLANPTLGALQIPSSVVDRRFVDAGIVAHAAQKGVTVFIRSIFLQGALLMPPDRLPEHLAPLQTVAAGLRKIADRTGRPLHELLLLAVTQTCPTAHIVIGAERADQIADHVRAMNTPPLDAATLQELQRSGAGLPQNVIDPSLWPR